MTEHPWASAELGIVRSWSWSRPGDSCCRSSTPVSRTKDAVALLHIWERMQRSRSSFNPDPPRMCSNQEQCRPQAKHLPSLLEVPFPNTRGRPPAIVLRTHIKKEFYFPQIFVLLATAFVRKSR